MNASAAIRRATQRAQNAMRELDAQNVAELLRIYESAAEEVRQRIARATDSSDSVPLQNLRAMLRDIEAIIDALAEQRDQLLFAAIERAAELGVEPFTLEGIVRVGGSRAVLDSAAATRVSQAAVRFVQTFTAEDGLTLSDRLWRIDRGAKETLTREIERAVVLGLSGTRAATDFIMRGEPVPADVAQRVAQAKGGPLGLLAGNLARRDAGALYQAERVMRTELNRAHGEAFMAGGEATPGRAGWRYLLSPLHPAPDICDLLSRQNLHGLGPGVYPTRETTPWPAHPWTNVHRTSTAARRRRSGSSPDCCAVACARRAQLVKELRDLESRREKLFDVLELGGRGAPGMEDLTERLQMRNAQIDELHLALAELEASTVPNVAQMKRIEPSTAIEVMREVVATGDPKKKRAFMGAFLEAVTVTAEAVTIDYRAEALLQMDPERGVRSVKHWLPDLGSNQGPTD